MGLHQDQPAVRKRRLMESVELISELLDGQAVTRHGEFFNITDACVTEPGQPIPLLVGRRPSFTRPRCTRPGRW